MVSGCYVEEKGCVGALVDGGIRDIRWIGEQAFPVYARYRTPVRCARAFGALWQHAAARQAMHRRVFHVPR